VGWVRKGTTDHHKRQDEGKWTLSKREKGVGREKGADADEYWKED